MTSPRIAWVFPSMGQDRRQGYPWHSVLSEFVQRFPHTTVLTAMWPGFANGFEETFAVEIVGNYKFVEVRPSATGYGSGYTKLSLGIVKYLFRLKPHVIITCAFSIWTLLILLLKPLGRWRVIIAYEGSSPSVDYQTAKLRLFSRRWMAKVADAFITNSQAGKRYLTDVLKIPEGQVFAHPYEIATSNLLVQSLGKGRPVLVKDLQRPIFITVGQVVPRKGLKFLLEACALLRQQGYQNYTLLIAGDGAQRQELEALSECYQLQNCVVWLGWVDYTCLGSYFQVADIFVFPTLEDTWGLVTLEAMVLGKPVICSKWAGTSELIIHGGNGYIVDPYIPQELAEAMRSYIDQPELIKVMGEKSIQLMAPYTPETVTDFLSEVIDFVYSKARL